MNENEISEMIELAMQARTKAYAPYSNFQVGACIKMENGSYYTGCNIENASYGQQTVRNGRLFLRQSVKDAGNCLRS